MRNELMEQFIYWTIYKKSEILNYIYISVFQKVIFVVRLLYELNVR